MVIRKAPSTKFLSKRTQRRVSIITFVAEWLQAILAFFFLGMLTVSTSLFAATTDDLNQKKHLCIYDPVGANGPVFSQMKDYQAAALDWGVQVEMKAKWLSCKKNE